MPIRVLLLTSRTQIAPRSKCGARDTVAADTPPFEIKADNAIALQAMLVDILDKQYLPLTRLVFIEVNLLQLFILTGY